MHRAVKLDVAGGRADERIGRDGGTGPLVNMILNVIPIAHHQRGDDEDGDEAQAGEDHLNDGEEISREFAHANAPQLAWLSAELTAELWGRRGFRCRRRRVLPIRPVVSRDRFAFRSEEHTSELQSL